MSGRHNPDATRPDSEEVRSGTVSMFLARRSSSGFMNHPKVCLAGCLISEAGGICNLYSWVAVKLWKFTRGVSVGEMEGG